jgi:hypothetical protein
MESYVRNFSMVVFLLTGCGLEPHNPSVLNDTASLDTSADTVSGDSGDSDSDSDVNVDMTALNVTSISPAFSTLSGGESVIISGGPFTEGAVVQFGDIEAAVSLITANEIIATAPAQDEEGPVDVSVIIDSQGGMLEDGFYYLSDGAGLAGSLGWSRWSELTGGYWNGSYSAGFMSFLFIQPLDLHTWELVVPSLDSCVRDGEYSYGNIYILDIGVDTLELYPQVGNSFSISYNPSTYFYELNPLSEQSYVAGSWYDLGDVSGGLLDGLGGVENFFRNSNPPVVLEPAISGDVAPTIYQNQTFRWTAGGSDWIEITIAINDATTGEYSQMVTCAVADDGEFQIDPSLFTSWPLSTQVDIYFTGVRESGSLLPFNGSESRIAGEYRLIGAGFSQ